MQVNLVDDRDDLQPVINREIRVRQRLRFDALRRVDYQQRSFARSQRTRNFIGKIHVARRVDQIELVGLAILRGVHHAHRVRLDRDAALTLQIHGVEHLRLHFASAKRAGELQQPVSQG